MIDKDMGQMRWGSYRERVLRMWGEPFAGVRLNPLRPDVVLDETWYLRTYPDVARSDLGAWEHFVLHGDAEGRSPGPDFDSEFYRRTYLVPGADRAARHFIGVGRALGYRGRPVAVDAASSATALRAAITPLQYPIVLVGNDAQRTGAPILLLEVASRLIRRGFSPVFLLRRGGPLLGEYRAHGPTFILDEGWNVAGLGAGLRPGIAALGSTGWSAEVIAGLGDHGARVVMIHEMVDYLLEHSLLAAIAECRTVVASTPTTQDELVARLGASTQVEMILPGLRPQQPTPLQRVAVRRRIEAEWGRGALIFLGAGYADHRKGFDRFLSAASRIAAVEPRARFVWLGELSPWARSRADAAVEAGLPVMLPGFRNDAAAWYSLTHAYLLTSRQDPGPTTVMDAARTGTPFVGYASDIGLRSLTDQLTGVGGFVEDEDAFVAEALRWAREDSAEARRRRARQITSLAGFSRYVDALLSTVATAGDFEQPTPGERQFLSRLVKVRQTASFARLALHRVKAAATVLHVVPEPLLWRAVHLAQRIGRGGRSPVSLAVGIGTAPPPGSLQTASEVVALHPGQRVWLARASLLSHLSRPAGLHLVRDPQVPPWELLRALGDSPGAVRAVEQYHLDTAPPWLREGQPPPPAQIHLESRAPRPHAVVVPARSEVAVGRDLGVFLHAYHLDLVEAILARLRVIEHPVRLHVSTDTQTKAAWLAERLPEAAVRVFPNRGRDVYPRLFGFAAEHDNHDLVLHLHTKRSAHSSHLTGWLDHCLDRLLPRQGVDGLLGLFMDDPQLGMLSPSPFGPILPAYGWAANRPIAEILTWGRGWGPLPSSHQLAFPAGSMFWARSQALAPVQALRVPVEVFPAGPGLLDGTLAHALERLTGVSPGVAGFTQAFLDLPRSRGDLPPQRPSGSKSWEGVVGSPDRAH